MSEQDKPWRHVEKFTEFFRLCALHGMDWQILRVALSTTTNGQQPAILLYDCYGNSKNSLVEGPRPSDGCGSKYF